MRASTASSRGNPDATFGEDCPTVMPTPTAETSREELERAYRLNSLENKATEHEKAVGIADKQPLSPFSGAQFGRDKGKGRDFGTSSTRTDTTAVYEGEGTEESPYIVDWSENDPENPMRWVSRSIPTSATDTSHRSPR